MELMSVMLTRPHDIAAAVVTVWKEPSLLSPKDTEEVHDFTRRNAELRQPGGLCGRWRFMVFILRSLKGWALF